MPSSLQSRFLLNEYQVIPRIQIPNANGVIKKFSDTKKVTIDESISIAETIP